jgi:hypothetical protein
VCVLAAGLASGCGNGSAPSPFASADAGSEAAPPEGGGFFFDGPPPRAEDAGAGEWGGPCATDTDCNDQVTCTTDTCDADRHQCHFAPDDGACDDGTFCNGAERCLPAVGCRPGEPVACSDGTACTIDACVEATHSCTHSPRDADGDGDPDGNCPGGHDCNDLDPRVSSLSVEICGNHVDDDCDGVVDEPGCQSPAYDGCEGPLDVSAPGSFELSAAAAKLDFAAPCAPSGASERDLAVAVHVTGDAADVDLVVTAASANVAIAAATVCGDASSLLACKKGVVTPAQTQAARLVLRGLEPGVHPVYLFSDGAGPLTLTVDYLPAGSAPANETCGTAAAIEPGVHVTANLAEAARDVPSACSPVYGDLVYALDLANPSDVRAYAVAMDAYGAPLLSLRNTACSRADSELTCREGGNVELFERALPAGRYYLDVAATGPSDVDVVVDTSAPTAPPPDETCSGAPALVPNTTTTVNLADHVDDIPTTCGTDMPDAAYALTLTGSSDVLLSLALSDSDRGAVSLATPACSATAPLLACAAGDASPVRATARAVPAGDYRVVVESENGAPTGVTAFVRNATSAVLVPFADGCDAPGELPSAGGLFEGNTANATDDFTASCGVGGDGAPDQLLHLHLDSPRRVVLDARGSGYTTIVDVRGGTACPGSEITGGCSAGYAAGGSYVDLALDAGDYWVQVDGYSGESGPWMLDVYSVPR